MMLYIVVITIVAGLATILWRNFQSGEGWKHEASFFVDLLAMSATALIVGVLAFNQLTSEAAALSESDGEDGTPLVALATEPVAGEPDLAPEETVEATDEPVEEVTEAGTATPDAATPMPTVPSATAEPTSGPEPSATVAATAPSATAEPTGTAIPQPTATAQSQIYIVKSGDRLARIASAYGVTTAQIAAANPGLNIDTLQVGQQLVIPSASAPAATPAPAAPTAPPRTYTVQSGDYLNTIAARFGLTTQQIIAVNPGLQPETLQVGQVLRLP